MERIDTLAKIAASLVGVQIEAAQIKPANLAADPFVLGYCFGLFEAMAQMAGLEQYNEAAGMMEAAFGKLVDQSEAGPALFRHALSMQVDATYLEGVEAGGADFAGWAADADALPTGMARRGRRLAE